MTTTDAPSKFRYEGNGSTDTFAFTGRIFAAEDLIVEIITRATDVLVDTLTLTTDYSVTINSASSASVTVTAPNIPSASQDILIRRALDQTQSLVLPTGTVFPAKSVETALDKVTAIIQELQEELDRKVGIPVTDSGTVPDLTEILEDSVAAQEAAEAAQAAAELAETNAEAAAATAVAAAAGVSLPVLGAANTVLQVNAGGAALEYEKVKALNVDINAATDTVITASDEIWFADATDSNLVKKDTVQGILDLVPNTGGWVPIKTVTASSSTTVDFVNGSGGVVLDGTYKAYAVVISSLVPATDNTTLYFRTSTNAGSSYDSGAGNYSYIVSDGSTRTQTTGTQIPLTDAVGNATTEAANVVLYLYNPANSTAYTTISFQSAFIDNASNPLLKFGMGSRVTGADVDAIRFLMSSGNIASGTFTLYGLVSAA